MSVDEAFVLLPLVLDCVTSAAWWQRSDAQLADAAGVFHRAESRLVAAQVAVLGEAMERGLPEQDGAKDGGVWLRGLVPVTASVACARAGLAEAFGTAAKPTPEHAPTREAFAAGAISPGHAGVIVRTMDALDKIPEVDPKTRAEVQELLLGAAGQVDPAQLGKAGARVRHRLDPDAAARLARDEDAQQEQREAYLIQESTGMWHLRGYLPPLAGAALQAALDPLTAPQPAADGTPDPRPGRHRMADGLHLLAELSLAAGAGQPGALPRRAGASTRLIVTADLSAVLADLTTANGLSGVVPGVVDTGEPGGWELSPLAVQTLSCGAEVLPILLDDHTGRPLDVGTTRYPFPPKIRRAIETRDQHCTFKACHAKPPWCHTHHLTRYPDGPTAEANGTLLCGRHHRFVHAHGWIGRIVDGHVRWRPPDADDEIGNAFTQEFEQDLKRLALRWISRNQQLEDPYDTS
jgi:hypothetical protein